MPDYKGTITRRMDSAMDSLMEEFRAAGREDFERKLRRLRRAEEKGASAAPSIRRELYELFDACGVSYEKGGSSQYYRSLVEAECAKGPGQSRIPTADELDDRVMAALYERFEEYPSPEDYMLRMVNRLCDPADGWEGDTLRLRILKQFIKYGGYLQDAGYGGAMVIRSYAKEKLGSGQKGRLTQEQVLAVLDDGIFDEMDRAAAELERQIEETEDPAQKKKLREKRKSQKGPNGKYGLLKAADDLAGGKFRTNGASKGSLYLFAMVYGMTYYTGSEQTAAIRDYESDIEKNLFQDYYNNNLIRFLSESYRSRRGDFERDPSGQGINYRNFAEMVYLYYIASDLAPQEKITRSAAMIDRLKIGLRQKEERALREADAEAAAGEATARLRAFGGRGDLAGDLYSEEILRLPEAEFEAFLRAHYDCRVWQTNENGSESDIGILQVAQEQNTAYAQYRALMEELTEQLEETGESLEDCSYGLWFADSGAYEEAGRSSLAERREDIDPKRFDDFMLFLRAADEFLGRSGQENALDPAAGQDKEEPAGHVPEALAVSSPDKITRTSLLTAYYYYFNALNEDNELEAAKSFAEVYGDFKTGADSYLLAACYQPFSSRNLFDVLLAFSAYARLHE